MQFGNFLFPHSAGPENDFDVITEALEEAVLSEKLGFDAVWLGEHHLDGACAYVDPITFAGAVAANTKEVTIGFSAVQMALHHPTRLAEQISLLDNLSKGRIILGLGRGTAYNFYEYRAYGIPFPEAQDRLIESEKILVDAWTNESQFVHKGKYFNLDMSPLRPRVYRKPHPLLIRALATEETMLEMAKQGRPFMLVVQSDDETVRRFHLYQEAMKNHAYSQDQIKTNLRNCWIWRNIIVAETDEKAKSLALPAFEASTELVRHAREYLNTREEFESVRKGLSNPRFGIDHSLMYGSPATIRSRIQRLEDASVGGLILHFRVGTLSKQHNEESLELFANEVMPSFRRNL